MSIMTSQEQQRVSIAFPGALVNFLPKNLNSTETLSFKCNKCFFEGLRPIFFKNAKLREPDERSKSMRLDFALLSSEIRAPRPRFSRRFLGYF